MLCVSFLGKKRQICCSSMLQPKGPDTLLRYKKPNIAEQAWIAPRIKKTWKYVYVPLLFIYAAAYAYSFAIQQLKDLDAFRKPWGVELALFSWLAVTMMALWGTLPERRRWENMREVIFYFRLTGDTLLNAIQCNAERMAEPVKEFSQLAPQTMVQVETTVPHAISHALHLLLLAALTCFWEITQRTKTQAEAESFIDHMKEYASYGGIMHDFKTNSVEIEPLNMQLARRFLAQVALLENNKIIMKDEFKRIKDCMDKAKAKSDKLVTRDESRLMDVNLRILWIFAVLVFFASPFLILAETGSHLIYVYPQIVLIVSYFVIWRLFIGDVFLSSTDVYTSVLYESIFAISAFFKSRLRQISIELAPRVDFDRIFSPHFDRLHGGGSG